MTTITVNTPVQVGQPRGARLAGVWFAALYNALQRRSEARAARRDAEDRLSEAGRVRRYAQEVMSMDPRFASDLFAAADRHERG